MATSFDNFDNTIKTFLSKSLNNLGINYSHSQIFGTIFEGIKGIIQNIMFYIEDALTEQNIETATRKKSVYSLAKISGYEPYYGSAATGTILGSVISNNVIDDTSKLIIPNHVRLSNNANGLVYTIELGTDTYIFDVAKPLYKHEFKIVQGNYTTSTYVAEGNKLETIHINTTSLWDKNYVKVTVNGEEFSQVSNIYDMTENSKEYIIQVGYDNAFDIMFGNGVYGYCLQEGDTVIIEYLLHAGSVGNILSSQQTDFIFADMIYDSLGNRINPNEYIRLQPGSAITGGTNSDSIDFIREMVGTNSRSLVLASEDNFKLFFKRFSFIGYVNCWSEKNSMTVIATCLRDFKTNLYSNTDYFNLADKDMILSNDEKEMIIETLNNSNRSFAGVTIKFQDPVIRSFAAICYVKPDNVYNKQSIETSIKETLANYFISLKENVNFIAKSSLITEILKNNKDIKAIDLDIISGTNESAYINGYYNTYELKLINETYQYVPKQVVYETNNVVDEDNYGNIALQNNLEIPRLGNIRYYPNKDSQSKESVIIPAVQVIFI